MKKAEVVPLLDELIEEVGSLRAVQTLDDILHRMRRHQDKKRPMLRPLHLASAFSAASLP